MQFRTASAVLLHPAQRQQHYASFSSVPHTLSLAAKNIRGMQLPFQTMSPHLHAAPTREYHYYPDVMFTFIPSVISDMFCHLKQILFQDICLVLHMARTLCPQSS